MAKAQSNVGGDVSSSMAQNYVPLAINRDLAAGLRAIQTTAVRNEDARQMLGTLLQSALRLEFATIPTYLSAAFSLRPNLNRAIYELILRAAVEEMLHFTAVANLMNAIGVAPGVVDAVPKFPQELNILEPPLHLDLRSFSLDLIEKLFMRIEAPENPLHFAALAAGERPKTIGQFYTDIIEIIDSDKIPNLFGNAVSNAYKQRSVTPTFQQIAYINNQDTNTYPLKADIDFRITDKASAVRHLSWIIDQGEGSAPLDPMALEGIPGHYYRFESILRSHYLVKNENAPLKYSFSGGDLPFNPAGVHEFDANAKVADYAAHPLVQRQMKRFNVLYTNMINSLQEAFNCPSPEQQDQAATAFDQAVSQMRQMPSVASAIVQKAQEGGIKGGLPFEYAGPPPTS